MLRPHIQSQRASEGAMADIYPVDPQFAAKARIDKTSYQ
jgi:acetyl-CoA synthetase